MTDEKNCVTTLQRRKTMTNTPLAQSLKSLFFLSLVFIICFWSFIIIMTSNIIYRRNVLEKNYGEFNLPFLVPRYWKSFATVWRKENNLQRLSFDRVSDRQNTLSQKRQVHTNELMPFISNRLFPTLIHEPSSLPIFSTSPNPIPLLAVVPPAFLLPLAFSTCPTIIPISVITIRVAGYQGARGRVGQGLCSILIIHLTTVKCL